MSFSFATIISSIIAAACAFVIWLLVSSPWGRLLEIMRDDELATRGLGKNVRLAKVQVVAISCGLASVAGALYGSYVSYVDPSISATAAVSPDGTWYEFGFLDDQNFVKACKQVDGAGFVFCTPSDGTPTQFAPIPAWEFNCPASGCWLTVTDAFLYGDIFEVFDNNISINEFNSGTNHAWFFHQADGTPYSYDQDLADNWSSLAPIISWMTPEVPALRLNSDLRAYAVLQRIVSVPEPPNLALVVLGLIGLGFAYRKKAA